MMIQTADGNVQAIEDVEAFVQAVLAQLEAIHAASEPEPSN